MTINRPRIVEIHCCADDCPSYVSVNLGEYNWLNGYEVSESQVRADLAEARRQAARDFDYSTVEHPTSLGPQVEDFCPDHSTLGPADALSKIAQVVDDYKVSSSGLNAGNGYMNRVMRIMNQAQR